MLPVLIDLFIFWNPTKPMRLMSRRFNQHSIMVLKASEQQREVAESDVVPQKRVSDDVHGTFVATLEVNQSSTTQRRCFFMFHFLDAAPGSDDVRRLGVGGGDAGDAAVAVARRAVPERTDGGRVVGVVVGVVGVAQRQRPRGAQRRRRARRRAALGRRPGHGRRRFGHGRRRPRQPVARRRHDARRPPRQRHPYGHLSFFYNPFFKSTFSKTTFISTAL